MIISLLCQPVGRRGRTVDKSAAGEISRSPLSRCQCQFRGLEKQRESPSRSSAHDANGSLGRSIASGCSLT